MIKRKPLNTFNKEEYLNLIKKLTDQQYDSTMEKYDAEKIEWIPAETVKKKNIDENKVINLSEAEEADIKDKLLNYRHFIVNSFKLKGHLRYGNKKIGFFIYEEKDITPNGNTSKMDYAVDITKDSRFNGEWSDLFIKNEGLSLDAATKFIRYLQIISKYAVFI